MKNLITISLIVMLFVGFTSTTSAQISIGANLGVAMPVGSFEQNYNMGFGGYATATYSLNDKMSLGFNAGFYAFKGIDFPAGSVPSTRIIPIFLDFKYFLNTEGFMPYVGTGMGIYLVSSNYTTLATPAKTVGGLTLEPEMPQREHKVSSKKFGVSPTVGFWLGDEFKYGASVTYHITFSDASYVGINIGVIYALGN